METSLKTSGFTLVEIIVVIGLIGLMAGLAFLSLNGPTREASLNNSYATVITALESARSKAMQGFGDGSGGQTVSISSDGKSIITETATLPFSSNVTADQAGTPITFDRISGASSAMTLTLTDSDGNTRTATITQDGYIYHE